MPALAFWPVLAAAGPWHSNSLFIAVVAVVWLILAYRVYGKRLERRVVGPTDAATPAHALNDGVDFYPARPTVLFGHHFASIAGAGPILGPVVALMAFGWLPTALWILCGVVVIGAVHDYLALMISVRHGGSSMPDVARDAISSSARILFLIFVWIGLVLVITAFCGAAARTFVAAPQIVLPTFSLMLIAVLFGFLSYKLRLGTALPTAIALALLAFVLWLGFRVPIRLEGLGVPGGHVHRVWCIVLLVYGVIASVLPVWVLLQPRDYIATWILVVGMLLGFGGIVWVHPNMQVPRFLTGVSASHGPMWPMLFILVACGAVSGFHCLVAGGTTSKQLGSERQGLLVGYGSMLVEGALAILALVAVGAGLRYMPGQPLAGGALGAFGRGFATLAEPFLKPVVRAVGGAGMTAIALGVIVGTTMVNAFVMTTLDTSVRLTRFIASELVGPVWGAFRNRFVASLAAVVPAYLLLVQGGAFDSIWPLFGAANQLIAALALVVISAYLLKRGKPTLYTVVPAVFMLATTMAALLWQAHHHLLAAEKRNVTLGVTALVLYVLAIVIALQAQTVRSGAAHAAESPRAAQPGGDAPAAASS